MIVSSMLKALGQMGDPRFRSVLMRGIGLTIALLIGAYALLLWLIEWTLGDGATLPLVGEVSWFGDLLSIGSLFVMLLLSVFLMIPVASAITSLFLDEVATAVEDAHYPRATATSPVPFWDALRDSVNFLGVLIGANLLAVLLYVMLPPAAPFIFIAMNGFLLGREYFTIAASRHLGRAGAKDMRAQHSRTIWIAGCLMAIPLTIPILNLVIPIFGAATFTHLYHQLTRHPQR